MSPYELIIIIKALLAKVDRLENSNTMNIQANIGQQYKDYTGTTDQGLRSSKSQIESKAFGSCYNAQST